MRTDSVHIGDRAARFKPAITSRGVQRPLAGDSAPVQMVAAYAVRHRRDHGCLDRQRVVLRSRRQTRPDLYRRHPAAGQLPSLCDGTCDYRRCPGRERGHDRDPQQRGRVRAGAARGDWERRAHDQFRRVYLVGGEIQRSVARRTREKTARGCHCARSAGWTRQHQGS